MTDGGDNLPRPVDPLPTKDGLSLPFKRHEPAGPIRASVLLLHGASASSETFLTPPAPHTNLIAYLNAEGIDAWTLDWRGSNKVAGFQRPPDAVFSINKAAEHDVPPAVKRIREVMQAEGRAAQTLGVLGHCLGGGVVAAAIADGHIEKLEKEGARVDRVVLSALGLFYAAPWDGFVKAQDYLLEQILAKNPGVVTIDVGASTTFPPPMGAAYDVWPKTLRVHCCTKVCYQLTFMFGTPYRHENLVPGIHRNDVLARLFNRMHLTLYVHCGQNLRRGVYAPLDRTEDRKRWKEPDPRGFTMPVTLITGEANTLWHREAIDRMHEWLLSHGKDSQKHVLSGFGHQDLYWGQRSAAEVFPKIKEGLISRGGPARRGQPACDRPAESAGSGVRLRPRLARR